MICLKQVLIGVLFMNSFICIYSSNVTNQGALIKVEFNGRVGFNLDEIPPSLLENAGQFILRNVTLAQWRERAVFQIRYSLYRQIFRTNFFYPKLQLTLPSEQKWDIVFKSRPYSTRIQNHSYIARNYSFFSVLIGKKDSIAASEPLLLNINGEFTDTFIVPADPEHYFQRSGYACVDEASFSLDTVNSENAYTYHDQECEVEPYVPLENRTFEMNQGNCHWTSFPNKTCVQALTDHIGLVNLNIKWTRINWNDALANSYRYPDPKTNPLSPTADLYGLKYKLEDEINVGYKFFSSNSCTLGEGGSGKGGCIERPGWRLLLKFTSSTVNVGKTDLYIGDVMKNEYLSRGLFEYDKCHLHYHFQHYEQYLFGKNPGRKTGFCVQTTSRYYNNEFTSFNTPHSSCTYQGITVGWGDDYYQGLDCQWIDLTDLKTGFYNLSIIANPDDFLCEGILNTDSNGNFIWIKTNFNTSLNTPVYRQSCNFTKNYQKNNFDYVRYNFKSDFDTLVSMPCKRQATLSPKKDCGFHYNRLNDNLRCTPGMAKTIYIRNLDRLNEVVVRVCESSKALGHSVFCEYISMLSNEVILRGGVKKISFACPSFRSNEEPGGLYSVLASPLIPRKASPSIRVCQNLSDCN